MTTSDERYPADHIVLDGLDALKVYFDPMRQKIIHQMIKQPKTVQQIAEILDVPFTRLYYHINLLEKHNIIHVVETRAMSGAVEEKYYQVAAYQFIVPRNMLSFSHPEHEASLNVFLSAMLGETADDIRHSVQTGRIDMERETPDPDSLLLRRGLIRMSREKISDFHGELLDLIKRYQSEPYTDDDSYYGLTIAVYPSAFLDNNSDDSK
ncbi:MAG: helix-turn-helix domain-containing protein [Phototrophicaceae bacterium]